MSALMTSTPNRIIKTVYVLCSGFGGPYGAETGRLWYAGPSKGAYYGKTDAKQYRTLAEARAAERLTRGRRAWQVVAMTIIQAS